MILAVTGMRAQNAGGSGESLIWRSPKTAVGDSGTLSYALRKGKFQGSARYFFMSTQNERAYSDYYAHALGGALRYESGAFHGFRAGLSGSFVFNIGSSDLLRPDSLSNQLNRYEIGLFDQLDPGRKKEMARLEELFLKYEFNKTRITAGRQLLNTPFINLQDGRMRPTLVEGMYVQSPISARTMLEGGFIARISPRGTYQWFRVASSAGIYPQGVNTDGSRSDYKNNLHSSGILLAGIHHTFHESLQAHFWEQLVTNMYNTAMMQLDYRGNLNANTNLLASAQLTRQDAVRNGGNADPAKTYFPKGNSSLVFSSMVGVQGSRWKTSLNYSRISGEGRFLSPREWGREPFFTFMPRERNEGYGNLDAYVARLGYDHKEKKFGAELSVGYFDLPAVNDFRLNKYGFPSYTQLNLDLKYGFSGWLDGLESQFLFVYKGNSGNTQGKYVINKVNMAQYNLVLNYYF